MVRRKMTYDLISFDMDGTLLSSAQTITPATLAAIRRAAEAGKTVVLGTGRSVSELKGYRDILSDVRYAICVSGGLLYDLHENKGLHAESMEPDTILTALRLAEPEDPMIQFLGTGILLEKERCLDLPTYHMPEAYAKLYLESGTFVEDLPAMYRKAPFPVIKMNLYHRSVEARERTRSRLLEAGLPVTMKDSEETSLELTKAGVNKAQGLEVLCRKLQIPLARTVAVGDAGNDLDILMAAGLPVAVGNAWPEIKKAVLEKGGAVVADNDHDGCAEAIDRCLLRE